MKADMHLLWTFLPFINLLSDAIINNNNDDKFV